MSTDDPVDSTARAATTAAIIADDLTGANDSAVQFAQQGWDTRLVLAGELRAEGQDGGHRAYAVTTDTRATAYDDACAATLAAVRQARGTGAEHLYLKIDSTVRGTVAAQVRGGLAAYEEPALAVVCPAYPRMGRTVEQSQLLVNGTPVAETALRNDPATPVTTSDLREVLPEAVALRPQAPTAEGYRRALAAAHAELDPGAKAEAGTGDGTRGSRQGGAIVVVDASTDAELDALADAIAELAAEASTPLLPVGSAALAGALSRAWQHPSRQAEPAPAPPASAGTGLMVQVSSLNPVALSQVDRVRADLGEDVSLLVPTIEALRSPDSARAWAQDQVSARGHSAGRLSPDAVTIVCVPEARTENPRVVAANLGEAFAALVRAEAPAAVGFVGGDGAYAALNALRCTSLRIIDSLTEGVPLATSTDGDLTGTLVFTKAGGFGGPETLTTSLTALRQLFTRSTT